MSEIYLESETMLLRPIEQRDLTLMYCLENNTSMWRASDAVQPMSRGTIMQYISSTQSDIYAEHQLRLTIELRTPVSVAIGFVDLTDFSPRHIRAEVGIGLLPEFQAKGYGVGALRLLERYAQGVLFLHQLYAYVASDNVGALRLFEKCGFKRSGKLTDWLKQGDSYSDVEIFQKIIKKNTPKLC